MVSVAQVLPPLTHHQLLLLFAELFFLLLTARGLGELTKRVGLPSVLGELLAGIVIGPSLLGALAPGAFRTLFPPHPAQYHLIETVSWIGLIMLLVVTGLETDLELIKSRIKSATYTALGGIVVPFGMGFGLGYVVPASVLATAGNRFVFSLFLGTALSISAIPVIAKVLIDMEMIHRDVGQITIASGMLNDTIGWILLALVASLARARSEQAVGTAGVTLVWLVIFLWVSFTLGPRLVEWLLGWTDAALGSSELTRTSVVMILALGVGTITHYLGLEAVLGAFIVGVLVGQIRRFDAAARHTFETITLGIFAPIFFATAGLRVDLTTMADPIVLGVGTVVIFVAIAGKFIGSYVGAKAAGLTTWEGIAVGSGLNARGALELIVATIGLSIGVLTTAMYTIIVTVAIVTSMLAPPLLRVAVARIEPSPEETDRIERAEMERASFLGGIVRVLLPTQCTVDSQLAAQLTGHTARDREIDVTSMYVDTTEPKPRGLLQRTTQWLTSRTATESSDTERKKPTDCLELIDTQLGLPDKHTRAIVRSGETMSETVLTEAADDYDLVVLGVSSQRTHGGSLFRGGVDTLIRSAPCPLLLVVSNTAQSGESLALLSERSVRRILLPTIGTTSSRHAAEIAFTVATAYDATVDITHVVNRSQVGDLYLELPDQPIDEAIDLGEQIVDREAELGRTMGADVHTSVSVGDRPERTLIERAAIDETDLIVLGSELRAGSHRTFFGHRVEQIVKNAPCPVVIYSERQDRL